jgi:hypothetical protein
LPRLPRDASPKRHQALAHPPVRPNRVVNRVLSCSPARYVRRAGPEMAVAAVKRMPAGYDRSPLPDNGRERPRRVQSLPAGGCQRLPT